MTRHTTNLGLCVEDPPLFDTDRREIRGRNGLLDTITVYESLVPDPCLLG